MILYYSGKKRRLKRNAAREGGGGEYESFDPNSKIGQLKYNTKNFCVKLTFEKYFFCQKRTGVLERFRN